LEFGIETTNNTSSNGGDIFDRESMIGLKIGKAHQVQFGNLKSPYKYSGGVKYDSFVATTLQARQGSSNVSGIGGAMSSGARGHGGFIEDSIAYKGNFGPVSVWAAYSPDETSQDSGQYASLGVTAKVSSFQFGVATMSRSSCDSTGTAPLCTASNGEYSAAKLFGSWSKAGHTVRAQVESTDQDAATGSVTGTEADFMYLNYQFKMGKHMIDVAIGEKDQTTTFTTGTPAASYASANDVDWSRLAYAYNFSKTTRVFAGITSTDDKGTTTSDNDVDVLSVGMTVKF
jgi:predicted porin